MADEQSRFATRSEWKPLNSLTEFNWSIRQDRCDGMRSNCFCPERCRRSKRLPIGWMASRCSRLRGRTMIRRLEFLCSHSILPASQMNKSLGLERFLQGLSPSAMVQALDREMVRRSLTEWCRRCGYVPAKHHRLIINKLERVARGEIDRLALFMPPGSAKSTYATILYPAWYLARGGAAIIAASHTAELAERWGRRTRNLIAEHSAILGFVSR